MPDVQQTYKFKFEFDRKDVKKQLKEISTDVRDVIAQMGDASDKVTVFKDLVSYLSNVDKALEAFKSKHQDDFVNIFGNPDTELLGLMTTIFNTTQQAAQGFVTLREKIAAAESGKADLSTLKGIAEEVNALFVSIGQTPRINIDEMFNGKGSKAKGTDFAGRIKLLNDTLVEFGVTYSGIQDKLRNGFNFGGSGGGFGSGGPGNVVQDKDVAQLQKLISKFDEARSAVQQFEAANNTSSDAYKRSVAEAVKAATLLKDTMDYIAEHGSDAGVLFVSNNTGKNDPYGLAEAYLNSVKNSNIFKDVQSYLTQQMKESGDVDGATSLYDDLNKKVKEYYELKKQIAKLDINANNSEYKDVSARITKVTSEIMQMKSLSDDDEEQLYDVFDEMSSGNVGEDSAIDRLCNILKIEIPDAANRTSGAVSSTFAQITNEANKASGAVQQVMYHIGNLLQGGGKHRDTFGDMAYNLTEAALDTRYEQYGFGVLGGGLFGVSDPSTIERDPKGSNFIQSIDLSKYNMYMADTEERAVSLIDFLSKLQKFSMKSAEPDYTGFDAELNGLDVDSLYGQFKAVFDQSDLTRDKFEEFINQMVYLIQEAGLRFDTQKGELNFTNISDKLADSDNISTRFMRMLGYDGVNVGTTSFDGLGQGSVLFDFNKTDIVGYFNTAQDAIEDYQKILNQANGDEWVGSTEQLKEYSTNIDAIIDRLSKYRDSGIFEDTSQLDETLNRLHQIKQNVGDILSGKSVGGSGSFEAISTELTQIPQIDQAKEKLDAFLTKTKEIQDNLHFEDVEIGQLLSQIDFAKNELQELAEQGALTREQLGEVFFAHQNAKDWLEIRLGRNERDREDELESYKQGEHEAQVYADMYAGDAAVAEEEAREAREKAANAEARLAEARERITELEGQITAQPESDEELDDIQKENGALEDKLEILRDIADAYGVQITQKDRNRYEELSTKEMEDGLTSKEEDRMSELSDKIDEADDNLTNFEETYDRIILKLSNGKKVEILPDDAGLRKLYQISNEYDDGEYGGFEIDDVIFERKKEQEVISQSNDELKEQLELERQINEEKKNDQEGSVAPQNAGQATDADVQAAEAAAEAAQKRAEEAEAEALMQQNAAGRLLEEKFALQDEVDQLKANQQASDEAFQQVLGEELEVKKQNEALQAENAELKERLAQQAESVSSITVNDGDDGQSPILDGVAESAQRATEEVEELEAAVKSVENLDGQINLSDEQPAQQPIEPVPTQTATEVIQQTVDEDPVDVPVEPVVETGDGVADTVVDKQARIAALEAEMYARRDRNDEYEAEYESILREGAQKKIFLDELPDLDHLEEAYKVRRGDHDGRKADTPSTWASLLHAKTDIGKAMLQMIRFPEKYGGKELSIEDVRAMPRDVFTDHRVTPEVMIPLGNGLNMVFDSNIREGGSHFNTGADGTGAIVDDNGNVVFTQGGGHSSYEEIAEDFGRHSGMSKEEFLSLPIFKQARADFDEQYDEDRNIEFFMSGHTGSRLPEIISTARPMVDRLKAIEQDQLDNHAEFVRLREEKESLEQQLQAEEKARKANAEAIAVEAAEQEKLTQTQEESQRVVEQPTQPDVSQEPVVADEVTESQQELAIEQQITEEKEKQEEIAEQPVIETTTAPVEQPVEPVPVETAEQAVQQTVPADPVDVPVEPVIEQVTEQTPVQDESVQQPVEMFESDNGQLSLLKGVSESAQNATEDVGSLEDALRRVDALDDQVSVYDYIADNDKLDEAQTQSVRHDVVTPEEVVPDVTEELAEAKEELVVEQQITEEKEQQEEVAEQIVAVDEVAEAKQELAIEQQITDEKDQQKDIVEQTDAIDDVSESQQRLAVEQQITEEKEQQKEVREQIAASDEVAEAQQKLQVEKQITAEKEQQNGIQEQIEAEPEKKPEPAQAAVPDKTFGKNLTKQTDAFNRYIDSLKGVEYISESIQTELDELGTKLQQVTDQQGLDGWTEQFGALKDNIKSAQSVFEEENLGKINLYRKELEKSYGKLTMPQREDLNDDYVKVISLLKQQEKAVKDGHAVELDSIKEITVALQEKINKQIELNNLEEKSSKPKKRSTTSYDRAMNRATAKHNSLSRTVGSDQFADSVVVSKAFDEYDRAYNRMVKAAQAIKAAGNEVSDKEEIEFLEAKDEATKYAKALEKIIDNSLKLKASKSNQDDYMLGSDFTDNEEGRKRALSDFAKEMYGVDVAATDFKDKYNKVIFDVDNGDGTLTRMTARFNDAKNEIIATAGSVKEARGSLGKFWDELKGKFRSIGAYLTASFSFHEVIALIKQGVNYIKEIDSALTELKKVTNETEASYDRFLQTMSKTANKVGSTISELTTMSASWARLGYNIEDSAKLAESTAVLLNVSEFSDATAATEALISTMQAFQYTADESMHVVDILNEVGNNYAVSSDGIATALQDSASALMAGGNSLEQATALVAAANRVVQDPNSVGSALRTISLRLRGTSVEILEEMGEETEGVIESTSKLQAKIKALSGVDILADSGEYKDTYTILAEIGQVWEDMSDIDQAALLELMAGKNRANTLSAILSNMKDLEGAYKTALNAEGSAFKENEAYLDSIQGRIDLFNNSVQTMWMNLIDSQTVKDIVDLGTKLIKFADDVGVLNVALTGLGMYLSSKHLKVDFAQILDGQNIVNGIKNAAHSVVNWVGKIKESFASSGSVKDWFKTIIGGAKSAKVSLSDLEQAQRDAQNAYNMKKSPENLKALLIARKNLKKYKKEAEQAADANKDLGASGADAFANIGEKIDGFIGKIRSALASMLVMWAITAIVDAISDAIDKNTETAEEAKQSFEDLTSELENTKSKLQSLESELSSIEDQIEELNKNTPLSFTEQEDLERLQAQSEELKRQIQYTELLQKQQQLSVNQSAVNAAEKYQQTGVKTGKTASENIGSNVGTGAGVGAAAGTVLVGSAAAGIGSAVLGAKAGTAIGTAIAPVIGTLIGALIGAAAGGLIGLAVGGIQSATDETIGEKMDNMTENYKDLQSKMQDARDKYMKSGDKDDQKKYEESLNAFNSYQAEMAQYMTEMESIYGQMDWETATEEERRAMQEFYNQRDKWAITSGGANAKANALDRLFGVNADEIVKSYVDLTKKALAAGESFDFTEADAETIGLDDELEELGITTQDVTEYFTNLGAAGAKAVEEIDFSKVVSGLAKIEGALGSVRSVMEEFRTDGVVSASTLDGMQETFGGLGEAWENYANTMMSGTATMAEAHRVTEDLAKAYLEQNAGNITKDTRLTYVAQLEKFGVDNATELVDSYISNSFWNSSEFANFKGNAEDLIKLAEEYGVVIEDTAKAEEILAAKENARTKEALRNEQILAQAEKKYEIEKQKEADVAKSEDILNQLLATEAGGYYSLYYNGLSDALTKTGQYSTYDEDALQQAIDDFTQQLQDGLDSLGLGYTIEDLFPLLMKDYTLETSPEIKISQEELDAAEAELQEKLDQMGLTVSPEIETAEPIDELARFESGMKSLSEAYQEYKKEGVVSFGTLSGLGDTFGNIQGVKDEYRDLIKLMGTSGTSISAIETQIERLATAYLSTIDANKMIIASEQERQVVIDNLTNMGVKNAEEIVNAKLKAIGLVQEAYGIDVSNYETAEAAKLAATISTALGIDVANSGLVTTLANKYGADLSNFVGTESEKVEAAKAAAREIAKAHAAEQIAALDATKDEEYKKFNPNNRYLNDRAALAFEQRFLKSTQAERDAINQKLQEDLAAIDAIGAIDPNDYIGSAFTGEDLDLDLDLGNDFWTGDGSGGSDSSNELDWLEHYFTDIENKIKEKEADLENVMSADIGGVDDKNTIIDGIIVLYESKMSLLENAMNAYEDRASVLFNSFSSDIRAKIQNGSIDISEYDSELAGNIQEYFDYITKASDLNIELNGVKVTVADLSLQKFNNASAAFDNEIEERFQSDQDLIEAEIGYLEEQGKRVSPDLYEKLIRVQKAEQKVLENKKKTLEDTLNSEVAAGRIQVGSEQWYEMAGAINDVNKAIIESKNDIESFQNAINDIYWDNFDKLIDRLDAVNSELANLFDLLSEDDKVVDEFGNWTDEGIASLGLLAQQMENAQAKANEYAQAIKDLDKDYADGKYSLDEYNEKSAELKDSYLSEIKNIEDLKDSMVDLNKVRIDAIKEGIDKEIEALEEKNEKIKESLDLEKEQYNWQKQVAEKEKSIADIQRRLNALAGDNSASAIAERRKLQSELAAAQQEMDDMWYEHSIEEQQKSLDESLDNYKENKEDEKEALDKWLEDEEKVIQASFDLFNSNVDLVSSVLAAFEQEHGIKLTEAITNPWNSGIDAMTAYRNELAKMKHVQEDAKDTAEDTADNIIDSLKETQTSATTTSSVVKQQNATQTPPSNGATVTVKKSATNFSRDGGNGTKMQSWIPGSNFTVYGSDSDEVLIGKNGGYTGWVKLSDIEGYYKGTTGVKYDQWAFTDELGPELTLHAGPNGKLQYLTKGSGVITADLTKRLMEWGELDPTKVLEQSRPTIGAPHITTNNFDIDLSFGSLVHVDHCDQNTLPDLQKMVRGEFDNMMKTLNQKLKRK